VDAVAAGLDLGWIQSSGRLANGAKRCRSCPPVVLTQPDVREFAVAKGASRPASGFCWSMGASVADVERVYSRRIRQLHQRASARCIGLLGFAPERVIPAGNTALFGRQLACLTPDLEREFCVRRRRLRHVCLSAIPGVSDIYDEIAVSGRDQ